MSVFRHVRPAVLVAVLASLTACGTERQSPADVPPPSPTASALKVSCGHADTGWPVSAMAGGIDSQLPADDLAGALSALAAEHGIDAPHALQGADIDDVPWFVLAETSTTATVAVGPWDETGPGKGGQTVRLVLDEGQWRARGWGGCERLSPVLAPGLQWVQLRRQPEFDPKSADLAVTVKEIECTSGRDPRPFLQEPTIIETDESVTVSWTSVSPVGAANCQGNPPVPQVLHLERPLGDRVLLDGSTWPPRPVPQATS